MGHEIAAISIPSFLVLVGILLNQRGLDKVETRIGQVEARLESKIEVLHRETSAKIGVLQRDLREFYRVLGQHDKAIEVSEKKI